MDLDRDALQWFCGTVRNHQETTVVSWDRFLIRRDGEELRGAWRNLDFRGGGGEGQFRGGGGFAPPGWRSPIEARQPGVYLLWIVARIRDQNTRRGLEKLGPGEGHRAFRSVDHRQRKCRRGVGAGTVRMEEGRCN